MSRTRQLSGYALRQRSLLAVAFLLSVATSLVAALQPWQLKILVDQALGEARLPAVVEGWLGAAPTQVTLIIAAALASLGLFVLNSVIDVGFSWTRAKAGQRMIYDLGADLFRKLQRLPCSFHQRRNVGDSLARIRDDTWCAYTITEGLLFSPPKHALTLATAGVVAWRLDAGLAGLSLLVAPALAIARALLVEAPILILDEPTSSVDARTEASLLAAIDRLARRPTTFIIAHRDSTIRYADRIVVLSKGHIVEQAQRGERWRGSA